MANGLLLDGAVDGRSSSITGFSIYSGIQTFNPLASLPTWPLAGRDSMIEGKRTDGYV